MIVWPDRALVLAVHDRQLAEHGGRPGLRDDSLLESALARPRQLMAYGDPPADLAELAASLAYGIARNHPFVDGNKRTAYVSCRLFLKLNGLDLSSDPLDRHRNFVAMAEGRLELAEFTAWLRRHLRVVDPGQVQETAAGPSYSERGSSVGR